MSFLILFFGLIFPGTTPTTIQGDFPLIKVLPHAQTCASEFNVNNAILNEFSNEQSLAGLFNAQRLIDRNVKCMIKCMLEKENYFADQKLNIQLTSQSSRLDIRKCIAVDDNDECELVFKAVKCIVEEVSKFK